MKKEIFSSVSLLLMCFASVCAPASNGTGLKTARIRTTPKRQASRFYEDIKKTCAALKDGTIIQFKKLEHRNSGLTASGAASGGGWRWALDESALQQHGLTYIATTIVEPVRDYEYAIQHLAMSSYAETAIPNYILVIPWDKTLVSGSWTEGLARACGERGYPLGHGVLKSKEAFEMIEAQSLDPAAFVESLKNGRTYQSLIASEIRCPECGGTGRIKVKSWIGKQKGGAAPCVKCAGTGMVVTNIPYMVSW